MIKAQLKNLIKTIHLVKEAGFSLLVFSIAISLFQGILPIFSMLLVQKMLNIITTDIKNFHTLMIAFISYIALTLLTIIIGEVDSYIDTKLQILLHYKMNHLVMQKTVKLTLLNLRHQKSMMISLAYKIKYLINLFKYISQLFLYYLR